eukprot:m.430944 g.430944  ORF g.430944 m.430944 type:complete len:432 (-) comp21399_c2_seq16:1907-3202(-)
MGVRLPQTGVTYTLCIGLLCMMQELPQTTGFPSPSRGMAGGKDPKEAAELVVNYILSDPAVKLTMGAWTYGCSILADAMIEATELIDDFNVDAMGQWVNPILDGFLNKHGAVAYDVVHNITLKSLGTAIGDTVGLYPHAYLHRATHYNTSATPYPAYPGVETDLFVATEIASRYVYTWPVRWTDGTISRNVGGDVPHWPITGHKQYVWGDDAYMGLTLMARLVVAGKDRADAGYAKLIAEQQILMNKHLRDPSDGLYFHGQDALTGEHSCCKWGRANGWTMMSHVEVLHALRAATYPGVEDDTATVLKNFQHHAEAVAKLQNTTDGRWHQLLNDSSTFLETSCTAMYIVSFTQAVAEGWLDLEVFAPVIAKAWAGLSSVIDDNGYVSGICDGFGIHATAEDYEKCSQNYTLSSPGIGSVLRAAVLMTNANL